MDDLKNKTQANVPRPARDVGLSRLFFLTYLIVGIASILLTRFTITTPDTFNYLLITEQLNNGEFRAALSTHWSIGIAILIAPFMALGIDGVLAFKIVQVIIGYFTLTLFLRIISFSIYSFSTFRHTPERRKNNHTFLSILAFIIALPLVISMTLELTADLLLTTLLLWYFYLLISSINRDRHRTNYAWKCGLVAGLAYWSKAYALPFFVVHFIGWHIVLWCINYFFYKKNKHNTNVEQEGHFKSNHHLRSSVILKNVLIGTVVFTLICLPCVLALSSKFDEPTIGMSGKYNFALISPHRQHDQLTKNELINPNTRFTDYWAYEEPALFVQSWSPFASLADVQYYVRFLVSNVVRFCYFDYARYVVLLLVFGLAGLWYIKARIDWKAGLFIGLTIFTALAFTSGYFLVLVRERYFWLDYFLGLILLFFLSAIFINLNKFNTRKMLLVGILIASLLVWKSIEIIQEKTTVQAFFKQLHRDIPQLNELKNKRIATNDTWGVYHHTDAAVYLMYALRYEFWGQIRSRRLWREDLREATEKEIDYFILWDAEGLEKRIFKDIPLVFRDSSLRMSVYRLKEEKPNR